MTSLPDGVVVLLGLLLLVIILRLCDHSANCQAKRDYEQDQQIREEVHIEMYDYHKAEEILHQARHMDQEWNGRTHPANPTTLIMHGSPSDANRLPFDQQINLAWMVKDGKERFRVEFTKPERWKEPFRPLRGWKGKYDIRKGEK